MLAITRLTRTPAPLLALCAMQVALALGDVLTTAIGLRLPHVVETVAAGRALLALGWPLTIIIKLALSLTGALVLCAYWRAVRLPIARLVILSGAALICIAMSILIASNLVTILTHGA